jgi:hypothetical protein
MENNNRKMFTFFLNALEVKTFLKGDNSELWLCEKVYLTKHKIYSKKSNNMQRIH